MKDLIEALTILLKYGDPPHPTHCEHDKLWVGISPKLVSDDDIARLSELGLQPDYRDDAFTSHRFGSY